jgi:hypothetical protein
MKQGRAIGPDCAGCAGGESYQRISLRGRRPRVRNTDVDRAAARHTAYLNVPLLSQTPGSATNA